jgi:gas vesicle protein
MKAVQGADKTDPGQIWTKTIEAWQESVKGTLEAQVEGSKIWAKSAAEVEGLPKEATEWATQIQEMTKNWTDMQQKMWDQWFDMVKKADPAVFSGSWDKDGENMLKTWQEMTKKMMDSQAEWGRTFAGEKAASK